MLDAFPTCWYHRRTNGVIAATHYGRHYCPHCGKLEIIPMCGSCKKNYDITIERHGNYDWECENCGRTMQRRVVGKV